MINPSVEIHKFCYKIALGIEALTGDDSPSLSIKEAGMLFYGFKFDWVMWLLNLVLQSAFYVVTVIWFVSQLGGWGVAVWPIYFVVCFHKENPGVLSESLKKFKTGFNSQTEETVQTKPIKNKLIWKDTKNIEMPREVSSQFNSGIPWDNLRWSVSRKEAEGENGPYAVWSENVAGPSHQKWSLYRSKYKLFSYLEFSSEKEAKEEAEKYDNLTY